MTELQSIPVAITVIIALMSLGGIALAFVPAFPASLMSLCALVLAWSYGALDLPTVQLVCWIAAAAVAVVLLRLLPRQIRLSRQGLGYIAGASVVGSALGAVVGSSAAVIVGAAAGVIIGALAYMRTPGGAAISSDKSKYINYVMAKGLPAIVAVSMAIIVLTAVLGRL